jgi:small subunit ribosomal protein S11
MAAEDLGSRVQILGVSEVIIILKGIGEGRNTAPKGLQKSGLKILSIKDVTPMPHNGCRPPKRRRV